MRGGVVLGLERKSGMWGLMQQLDELRKENQELKEANKKLYDDFEEEVGKAAIDQLRLEDENQELKAGFRALEQTHDQVADENQQLLAENKMLHLALSELFEALMPTSAAEGETID